MDSGANRYLTRIAGRLRMDCDLARYSLLSSRILAGRNGTSTRPRPILALPRRSSGDSLCAWETCHGESPGCGRDGVR